MVLGKQTKLKGLYYTLTITRITVIAFFVTVTSIQYLWRGCPWRFTHVISFNPHNSWAGGIMIATSQEGRMRPREFKWPAQLHREVHGKCENCTRWGGSLGFAIRQTWSFSWCPWGCQSCRGHVLSFQIRPSWKSEGEPDAMRLNLSPDSSGRCWWKSAGLDEVCREGFLEGEGSLRT